MKIQILGGGCPKCRELARRVESAVKELGLNCELEKITDINEMIRFGIMMTPALVVDGKVRVVGKVPDIEHLKTLLR